MEILLQNKMIIKIWCFIVLLPLLSSCAHHASVNPDFYSENLPQYSSKIPLSVVISDKDKYIQDIHGNQQVMLKKITVMPVLLPTIVLYST
jgi:hypothetical protein